MKRKFNEFYAKMNKELEFINPEGLIKKMNSIISVSEGFLELQNLKNKEIGSYPSLLSGMIPLVRERYDLIQIVEGCGIINYILGMDNELRIGGISFETGILEETSDYGGRYEKARLKTRIPLKLRKGHVLPACDIRLFIKAEDDKVIYKEREDFLPFLIYSKRTDLSAFLDTKWFLV